MKRCFIVIAVVFFISLSLSSPSFATMKGLSTEELTNDSDIVVQGEVQDSIARWSNDGKSIMTSADIVVDKVIKGKTVQATVRVEYEGGEIGDIGMKVSDQSSLAKGEKVLLFLKSGNSRLAGSAYHIVGKAQGKYVIDQNGIARKSGFSLAAGKEKVDNNIPVDELIQKIKKAER
jgi:hypothetical protein